MANEKNRVTPIRGMRRKVARLDTPEDLATEIAALRQLMARLDGMADQQTAFAELADFMEKYSRSSTRLVTLLRAQRELAAEQGVGAALSQALAEALEEMEAKRQRNQAGAV